jgi:hypothetical protein
MALPFTYHQREQQYEQQREEVKARLDIVTLASLHTNLKKAGLKHGQPYYKGLCPFHSEDTASFNIFEHDNSFHCYGCQAHGNAIDFIARTENLDRAGAWKKAKELVGLDRTSAPFQPASIKPTPKAEPKADINWENQAWQVWAEAQVTAAGERMTGPVMARFQKERGLDGATVKRFEVGWTGDKPLKPVKIGDRSLFIRSHSWTFPVRNESGQIQMLKWRHTLPEHIKKYGKYGQLAGGQGTLFNLKAARSRDEIVLCTGEFETMVLWQEAGIEATCHTAGEAASFDIDTLFGSDKPVVYVADNDTAGKKAASDKQSRCERLRVAYVTEADCKDLTDKLLKTGFTQGEIEALLVSAKSRGIAGRRRKTQSVQLGDDEEDEGETVELETARIELARTARQIYAHPKLARAITSQIAAQPGVGKGHAINFEVTEQARAGKATTAWFGQRHDQYHDQARPADWWKQIKGRKPARSADGEPVDFNSPWAVPGEGNCTVEGAALATKLGEKGWEREFHKYCKETCPAYKECQKSGYYAQLKKDGRNAYMTFEQMFTTLGKDYRSIVIDEPSYRNFVETIQISKIELSHMRRFVINAGMQFEMRALLELIRALDETVVLFEEWQTLEGKAGERVNGAAFLTELDNASRSVNQGRGLLEILRQADNTPGVYGEELWELLAERSVEAAEKLPLNFWHIRGAEPGAGGLYDLIKEEASNCLIGGDGQLPMQTEFVSRLELVRGTSKEGAKLLLHRRRYLPYSVASKPVVALDATGDPVLLRELLSYYENHARYLSEDGKSHVDHHHPDWHKVTKPVVTVAPRVEMPGCVTIVQDTQCNFSKTALVHSIEKDPKKRYWNLFLDKITGDLDREKGRRCLITVCKEIEPYLAKGLAGRGYAAETGYHFVIKHYGDLRGSNEFQDYDCLIQAGQYMPEPNSVIGAARAIYGGDGRDLDTTLTRIQRLHNFKDEEGRGLADEVLAFRDQRIQRLLEIDREDEHIQALHRIRPLTATTPKVIYLHFSIPLKGVKIDRFEGNEDYVNPRSSKVKTTISEELKAACDLSQANPFVTNLQLIERLAGKVSRTSVYKYLAECVAECGLEMKAVPYFAPLKGGKGGERWIRRDLIVVAPIGSSRTIIHTLIILRELPIYLPAGSRIATLSESEGVPDLVVPVIESAEEASASVRGEASARLHYLKSSLEKAFAQALDEREGQYSTKAAIIRELHLEYVGELNRLVKQHQSRLQEKASA